MALDLVTCSYQRTIFFLFICNFKRQSVFFLTYVSVGQAQPGPTPQQPPAGHPYHYSHLTQQQQQQLYVPNHMAHANGGPYLLSPHPAPAAQQYGSQSPFQPQLQPQQPRAFANGQFHQPSPPPLMNGHGQKVFVNHSSPGNQPANGGLVRFLEVRGTFAPLLRHRSFLWRMSECDPVLHTDLLWCCFLHLFVLRTPLLCSLLCS